MNPFENTKSFNGIFCSGISFDESKVNNVRQKNPKRDSNQALLGFNWNYENIIAMTVIAITI